ncbi:hypothetical protein MASR2M78_04510 [Treponema sp.]
MKTLKLLVFALCALVSVLPLAAQDAGTEKKQSGENWSEFYYVNVPIEKVYPHRLGYVVTYRKQGSVLGQAYLPMKWFTEPAGRGDLLKIHSGATWPYLSIYYKDGKFAHARLLVRADLSHQSWGNLPQGTDIDSRFDIEELILEY